MYSDSCLYVCVYFPMLCFKFLLSLLFICVCVYMREKNVCFYFLFICYCYFTFNYTWLVQCFLLFYVCINASTNVCVFNTCILNIFIVFFYNKGCIFFLFVAAFAFNNLVALKSLSVFDRYFLAVFGSNNFHYWELKFLYLLNCFN